MSMNSTVKLRFLTIIPITIIFLYSFQVSATDTFRIQSSVVTPSDSYTLIQPSHSGNGQYQIEKLELPESVRVLVIDTAGLPAEGVEVFFSPLSQPPGSSEFSIYPDSDITDSLGFAIARVKLGTEPGDYQISARIEGKFGQDILVYSFHARKSNWFIMLMIGLLGGLGLFFLGMKMMSTGMQNSAGDRMRIILSNLTYNRFIALGVGTFVTTAIQSSSATCVMLVGFVHSKLMEFRQTIGVMLGAVIGTTITAQIIAFKLTDYSLLIVAAGLSLYLFVGRQRIRNIGEIILGFGILFFGMHIMSESMYPLRTYAPFINVLYTLENPLLGLLVGTIFTALIQSSSTFIGIVIVLATQGLISLEAAIPLLLGSNIGTALTTVLASLNTSAEAKKVALALTIFKIIGVLLIIWWIPPFARLVEAISPKGTPGLDEISSLSEILPRQIANAHTLFNVFLAFVFLPFTTPLARLVSWIIPVKTTDVDTEKEIETTYLDFNLIKTPSLGLSLAKEEALRVGRFILDMVKGIIKAFTDKDETVISRIEKREKQVDFLVTEIHQYLMKITRGNINEQRINEAFQIMYTVKEFEQIADVISKILLKRARTWLTSGLVFSDEGKTELIEYHGKAIKQISRAIEVFRELNLEKAHEMKAKYKKYRAMAIELEKHHYERLMEEIAQTISSSETHLELITTFRVIAGHATNVARMFIEWSLGENQMNHNHGNTKD